MSIRSMQRSLPTETMLRDTEVPWTIFLDCDRAEHRALAPALMLVEGIADALDRLSIGRLAADLDMACAFFDGEVIPHIRAACQCRRLATTNGPAASRCYDCDGVGRLIPTLRALLASAGQRPPEDAAAEVRRVVGELHVVTRLHFVDLVIGARVRSSEPSGEALSGGSSR
jgi:hypothetical protein